MLSRLFIAALWSSTGKELISWLLFVMINCVFDTFPCGILGLVWYLIVSSSDPCRLSYFNAIRINKVLAELSEFIQYLVVIFL